MVCLMVNVVRFGLFDLLEGVDLFNFKEVRSLLIKLIYVRKLIVYGIKIRCLYGVIVNFIMENYNSVEGEFDMVIILLILLYLDYVFLVGRVFVYMM